MCVCVCEREGGKEGERGVRERAGEREGMCVCVCACVYVCRGRDYV